VTARGDGMDPITDAMWTAWQQQAELRRAERRQQTAAAERAAPAAAVVRRQKAAAATVAVVPPSPPLPHSTTAVQDQLWDAANEGDAVAIGRLLAAGAGAGARAALQCAARNGHTEVVQLLLAAGAGTGALEAQKCAACIGHTEVVQLLQEQCDQEAAREAARQKAHYAQMAARRAALAADGWGRYGNACKRTGGKVARRLLAPIDGRKQLCRWVLPLDRERMLSQVAQHGAHGDPRIEAIRNDRWAQAGWAQAGWAEEAPIDRRRRRRSRPCTWTRERPPSMYTGLQGDRRSMLAAVAMDAQALRYADRRLQADREVVLTAVVKDGLELEHASPRLRADREVVLTAVVEDGRALQHACARLKADREVVLAAVAHHNGEHKGDTSMALQHASTRLRADRQVVLAALAADGCALQHASTGLRADKEVVMAGVAQHWCAMSYASGQLLSDREFVLAAMAQDPRALLCADEQLLRDRGVMLAAVTHPGDAEDYMSALTIPRGLDYMSALTIPRGARRFSSITLVAAALMLTSAEVRGDRELMLAAVSRYGCALQYASTELQGDREVVLAATAQDARALEYAALELRSDQACMLAAVALDGNALRFASAELTADQKVVMAAVNQNGSALEFASKALRTNGELVRVAVANCGEALQFAARHLRATRAVVAMAVKQYCDIGGFASGVIEFASGHAARGGDTDTAFMALFRASELLQSHKATVLEALGCIGDVRDLLRYTSTKLRADREVVMAAVRKRGAALQYASSKLRGDREVVMAAVRKRGAALQYASSKLRGDREVVMAAVTGSGAALQYASSKLQADREVVLAALRQHPLALQYASLKLRGDSEVVGLALSRCGSANKVAGCSDLADRQDDSPLVAHLLGVVDRGVAEQYARRLEACGFSRGFTYFGDCGFQTLTADDLVRSFGFERSHADRAMERYHVKKAAASSAAASAVVSAERYRAKMKRLNEDIQLHRLLQPAASTLRGGISAASVAAVVQAPPQVAKASASVGAVDPTPAPQNTALAKKVMRCASYEIKQEHQRLQKRDRQRQARGGLKRQRVLPADDGYFHCAVCWARGEERSIATSAEQLRSHARRCHPGMLEMAQFRGHVVDHNACKQYGLCLCGATPCTYRGATIEGDVWVRDPLAASWQDTVIREIRGPKTDSAMS
jgi:hypothetical protein